VIVVDTNVIAGLYLGKEAPSVAEQVLARDPKWAVPMLWRYEFRNVLAGEIRRGAMSFDRAARIASLAEARVRRREFIAPSDAVLELVSRTRCTAYDCEFVALARGIGARLVTSDRQVLAAFPETAISPESFVAH
jgi:predicted nucleic acid-binding protein